MKCASSGRHLGRRMTSAHDRLVTGHSGGDVATFEHALRGDVETFQRALRVDVATFRRAFRGNVATCGQALRGDVANFGRALRVDVATCGPAHRAELQLLLLPRLGVRLVDRFPDPVDEARLQHAPVLTLSCRARGRVVADDAHHGLGVVRGENWPTGVALLIVEPQTYIKQVRNCVGKISSRWYQSNSKRYVLQQLQV